MKTLFQNLGAILVLVGVCFFALYFFATVPDNWMLATGIGLEFLGLVTYTLVNKFVH